MAKVHVFIVYKLMTSSEFLCSRELSKSKKKFKKNWGVHGRWSMGWSMEGVQGVVHGRGPRGGSWKGSKGWSMDWGSVFSTLAGSYVAQKGLKWSSLLLRSF